MGVFFSCLRIPFVALFIVFTLVVTEHVKQAHKFFFEKKKKKKKGGILNLSLNCFPSSSSIFFFHLEITRLLS